METKPTKVAKVEATEAPAKENKKVQISIKMLKDLAENRILLEHFIETLDNNEEMKAPIAYQFAQAMVKQTKLEI